jgi:hypothetical protein
VVIDWFFVCGRVEGRKNPTNPGDEPGFAVYLVSVTYIF